MGIDVTQSAIDAQRALASVYRIAGRIPEAPTGAESTEDYVRRGLDTTRRLLDTEPFKQLAAHNEKLRDVSVVWANTNFQSPRTPWGNCKAAFKQITDAATDAFYSPVGPIRSPTENDRSGRPVTKFFGNPESVWAPFKQKVRRVAAWSSKKDNEFQPAFEVAREMELERATALGFRAMAAGGK